MKFSCQTSALLEALQLVSRAIGGQQALPILGNILFQTKENECVISATNLELSIITILPVKSESEGSITIPAKAILNFAQYNNDPEVLIEVVQGTQVKCTSLHAKTSIAGESAAEYPMISKIEEQTSFSLEAHSLLHALHLVTFACAKTTLRPVLSGVYVRTENEELILASTDSYRLSEYRLPIENKAEISCIIPVKILDELKVILGSQKPEKGGKKSAAGDSTRVLLTLSKQQIEVQIGGVRLLSRLIDGKFPNYSQILPKETKSKILFSTHDLLTAAKRLHYFAKEVNNNLTFQYGKTETVIATPQTQIGQDEATVQAELTGTEGKIALSSNYLLDFLGHIESDVIVMTAVDSQRPALFTLPSEQKFIHLIMPLRMQE